MSADDTWRCQATRSHGAARWRCNATNTYDVHDSCEACGEPAPPRPLPSDATARSADTQAGSPLPRSTPMSETPEMDAPAVDAEQVAQIRHTWALLASQSDNARSGYAETVLPALLNTIDSLREQLASSRSPVGRDHE